MGFGREDPHCWHGWQERLGEKFKLKSITEPFAFACSSASVEVVMGIYKHTFWNFIINSITFN